MYVWIEFPGTSLRSTPSFHDTENETSFESAPQFSATTATVALSLAIQEVTCTLSPSQPPYGHEQSEGGESPDTSVST